MGRPHRIEYAGAIHHIVSRSNAGEEIFRHDRDASAFCATLRRAIADYEWICSAYRLMPTHYHLLLRTPRPTLSTGMHWLNASYARLFNASAARRGHVFQKRFHSELISGDAHFLEALRYVALNPVRAGLVGDPGDWPWSSYRATAGVARTPPWLSLDESLLLLATDVGEARTTYRRFVLEGERTPSPRETQAEMARRLGVSQATVSRMLRKQRE